MCFEITFFSRTMNRKKDNVELSQKSSSSRHWLSLCMFFVLYLIVYKKRESTSHTHRGWQRQTNKNFKLNIFTSRYSILSYINFFYQTSSRTLSWQISRGAKHAIKFFTWEIFRASSNEHKKKFSEILFKDLKVKILPVGIFHNSDTLWHTTNKRIANNIFFAPQLRFFLFCSIWKSDIAWIMIIFHSSVRFFFHVRFFFLVDGKNPIFLEGISLSAGISRVETKFSSRKSEKVME